MKQFRSSPPVSFSPRRIVVLIVGVLGSVTAAGCTAGGSASQVSDTVYAPPATTAPLVAGPTSAGSESVPVSTSSPESTAPPTAATSTATSTPATTSGPTSGGGTWTCTVGDPPADPVDLVRVTGGDDDATIASTMLEQWPDITDLTPVSTSDQGAAVIGRTGQGQSDLGGVMMTGATPEPVEIATAGPTAIDRGGRRLTVGGSTAEVLTLDDQDVQLDVPAGDEQLPFEPDFSWWAYGQPVPTATGFLLPAIHYSTPADRSETAATPYALTLSSDGGLTEHVQLETDAANTDVAVIAASTNAIWFGVDQQVIEFALDGKQIDAFELGAPVLSITAGPSGVIALAGNGADGEDAKPSAALLCTSG